MRMRPFLILQLRPETDAADNEFDAFLDKGGFEAADVVRIRLDQDPLPADFSLTDYSGIIVGGGPGCVSDPNKDKDPVEKRIEDEIMGLMPAVCESDTPFLGCCYGMGILGHHLTPGSVSKEQYGEPVGGVDCTLTKEGRTDPLLKGIPQSFRALVGHKEAVQVLPKGSVHLVASGPAPFQMLKHKNNIYATQFHPEADAQGFETRIHIYKHRGYFPPERADSLIREIHQEDIRFPALILQNFRKIYAS